MNMNDLTASFITLFALMVVNNWYVTTAALEAAVGNNHHARWFSITFYVICVIITLDIVVAFTIDMYGNVADLQRAKDKEAIKKMKEASG
jgi:hypothetical protein